MADIKINLGATGTGSPAQTAASAPTPLVIKPTAAVPAPLAVKPPVAAPSATSTPAVKPTSAAPLNLKPASPTVAPVPLAILTPAAQAPSSFKDLFNKTADKTAGPKMLETLGASKTTVADKLKPILGSSPQLKKTLEQEKEHRQKKMLRTSQVIFVIAMLLSLGSAFYFYSELSPSFNLFGLNTTAKITEENAKLRSLKKTENKFRYLAAQLDLNSFSFATTQYLDKTAKLADPGVKDKGTLEADIAELETSIPTILESLRKNIGQPTTLDLFAPEGTLPVDEATNKTQFDDDLRTALQEYRTQLAADAGASTTIQQDLKFVDNAIKLVGNNTLRSTLLGLSIDDLKADLAKYSETQDSLIRDKLQKLFTSVLSSTSSDIATIGSIKAARINWLEIIKQIEAVTASVDINFGKGLYSKNGGINYLSYTFDQQSAKIALSGETKTADATNFTLITKLVIAFEDSPYFTGAEVRSFSKSGSTEMGYAASFSLDLSLESGGMSSKNKTVTLGKDTLKDRTGIRRIKRMP